METIYYISVILFLLSFLGLPILLIILLIKPHLLNGRSFIKNPFSRGKIAGVVFMIFLVSLFGFGGVISATEPEYVKQDRIKSQLAEEAAKKDTETQKTVEKSELKKPHTKQETKSELITFDITEQQDNTIPKGESRTILEGSNGERVITYEVTYQEGRELTRKELKSEITKQPISEIVKIGTYVASTPTLQESGSSASSVYYRNCSAVRAAGAAPVYAGQPGYGSHLDRDGDGVGCE